MEKTVLRVLFLILTFFAQVGYTAEKPGLFPASKQGGQASTQELGLDDPWGRSTPDGTVFGFMKAVEREDYERAVEYLDTKQSKKRAEDLARQLKYILDWGFSTSAPKLSKKPEGDLEDSLQANREKIGTVKTNSASYVIMLERIQRGNDPAVWLFSSETLKQIPQIYRELDYSWVERNIPKPLLETRFLNRSLWTWIAFIVGVPLAYFLAWIITHAFLPLITALIRRFTHRHIETTLARTTGPIRVLFLGLMFYIVSIISYSLLSSLFWRGVAVTVALIGTTWLCLRLIDIVVERFEDRPQVPVSSGRVAMTRLISKLSKALLVVVGAVIIFYSAGINFTAVLTGLGVGGIAIAFAAQKTLENLFGGVMIISDQPIRVGDFCRAGEYQGVVEDIGLRSTRLRTLKRTVVFVPNAQLAAMSLENFTMRDKMLFNHRLQLRYETSPDQLRYVIAEMRKLLYSHPRVETESARVRFMGLKDSSVEIEVFAYVLTTEYVTFLEVQEDLLMRVMDIVKASGTGFAFPSQTMYFTRDKGLDQTKGQEATGVVKRWREQGELPFPDFAPEEIAEMDNTLEYPSADSAARKNREAI
jgi:MscS family membrane protein